MKLLNCQICGGELKQNGDHYECAYCRHQFQDDTLERAYSELKNSLEGVARGAVEEAFVLDQERSLANLRKNLWKETHEKYINSRSIVKICRDMKKINPDDFCANFYEVINDETENAMLVSEFLDGIDVIDTEMFLDDVIDFVLKSLKVEYLTSLNMLVERAYKQERTKYEEIMTKIEDEAKKVESGLYETYLSRDVFVAYSSQDIKIVNELVSFLEGQGVSCFVALRNLQHGRKAVENYERALETAMDNCKIFLLVSSKNSRSLSCDAIKREIPYIKKKDLEFKPEYRNDYGKMPEKYRKPRIQYRVDDKPTPVVDRQLLEFFGSLQWRSSLESVAEQIGEYLSQEIEDKEEVKEEPQPQPQQPAFDQEGLYAFFRKMREEEETARREEEKKKEEARQAEEKRKAEELEKRRQEEAKTKVDVVLKDIGTKKLDVIKVVKEELSLGLKEAKDTVEALGLIAENMPKPDADELVKKLKAVGAKVELAQPGTTPKPAPKPAPTPTATTTTTTSATTTTTTDLKFFDIQDGKLNKYKGRGGDVVIPGGITEIVGWAFDGCEGLTSVTIPAGVKKIYMWAFKECPNLKRVNVPASVMEMKGGAFKDCPNLTIYADAKTKPAGWEENWNGGASVVWGNVAVASAPVAVTPITLNNSEFEIVNGVLKSYKGGGGRVVVPSGVTELANGAFREKSSITELILPEGLEVIGDHSIRDCKNLYNLVLPKTLKSVGRCGLSGCKLLKEIVFPEGFTTIGDAVFQVCDNLQKLYIPASVTDMGDSEFYECKKLTVYVGANSEPMDWAPNWNKQKCPVVWGAKPWTPSAGSPSSVTPVASNSADFEISNGVLTKYKGRGGDVVIPNGVTEIGANVFDKNESITSVTVPYGVTKIGGSAFNMCKNLKSISLPDSLTEIGSSSIRDCRSLARLVLPRNLKKVGDCSISGCSALTEVIIPYGVTYVGRGSFQSCTNLKKLVIPETATQVGDVLCWSTPNVTIYAEASSKPASWHADWNKYNFPVVWNYGKASAPTYTTTSVTPISRNDSTFEIVNGVLKSYKGGGGRVVVPSGVTELAMNAFRDKLLSEIVLPVGLKKIGKCAFCSCKNLKEIILPEGVTEIEDAVFQASENLQKVYIPASVIKMGDSQFWNCKNLKVYLGGSSAPSGWVSTWNKQNCPLYWNSKSGAGTSSYTPTSTYTSSSSSADFVISNGVLKEYKGKGGYVVVPSGVREIGESVFKDNKSVTSVVLPAGLQKIGQYAFERCKNMTSITIPDSVTEIAGNGIRDCESLLSLKLPANLKKIGFCAMSGCRKLTEILIPYGVTTIERGTFQANTALKKLTIPSTVTTVGDALFWENPNLTVHVAASSKPASWDVNWNKYNIPVVWGSTGAGTSSYSSTSSYTSSSSSSDFVISGGVLKEYKGRGGRVVVPSGVTEIGESVFKKNMSITSVVLPYGLKKIGTYAFEGCKNMTSITIPDTVTEIAGNGIRDCSSLLSLKLPASLKKIGFCAISGCEKLPEIIIPEGTTTVERGTFQSCTNLKKLVIPASVTTLGDVICWSNPNVRIYVGARSKPYGWHADWNKYNFPVTWGYGATSSYSSSSYSSSSSSSSSGKKKSFLSNLLDKFKK